MDKLVDYLCIIQARLSSSRLPAKVMLDLDGKIVLERVYESLLNSQRIDTIVVATSTEVSDNIIENKLKSLNIKYYRGNLNNVLKRFYDTAIEYNPKNIIRITADNPLMDGKIIDDLIKIYENNNAEYSMFSNAIYGLSAEVFSFKALEKAYSNARNEFDKEHVTPYIKDNAKCYIEDIEKKYKVPNLSITIDTLADYITMNEFYIFCATNKYITNIDTFLKYQLIQKEI